MAGFLKRFRKDVAGTTAIEYGLIAGLIVVVVVSAIGAVMTQVGAMFLRIQAAFP